MTSGAVVHLETRRDWVTAIDAIRKLLADGNDTTQVFRIMRALNAGSVQKIYSRLISTQDGGRLAFNQVELLDRLTDQALVASFAEGTVGAAYRSWLKATGYSANGLADISRLDRSEPHRNHPYAWAGRRVRDMHDLWHVLTGYEANVDFGEVCLVAFSYAQTRALGWGFIAGMSTLKHLRRPYGRAYLRSVWEAYKLGRRASWLFAEDYDEVLAEPLKAARTRLLIGQPAAYLATREIVARSYAH